MGNTTIDNLPATISVSPTSDYIELAQWVGGTSYVSKRVTINQIGLSSNMWPGGTAGQVQYYTGTGYGGFTVSGDGTLNTSTGALTITKTNGVPLGALATLSTLPLPTASTLGGVESASAPANSFMTGIDTTGTPQFGSAMPIAAAMAVIFGA